MYVPVSKKSQGRVPEEVRRCSSLQKSPLHLHFNEKLEKVTKANYFLIKYLVKGPGPLPHLWSIHILETGVYPIF